MTISALTGAAPASLVRQASALAYFARLSAEAFSERAAWAVRCTHTRFTHTRFTHTPSIPRFSPRLFDRLGRETYITAKMATETGVRLGM